MVVVRRGQNTLQMYLNTNIKYSGYKVIKYKCKILSGNTGKYKYCNNVFKCIRKYFSEKQKNRILKKNLANTVETMPKWLSIFMLLLKRSLHYQYHLLIREKKFDCRINQK